MQIAASLFALRLAGDRCHNAARLKRPPRPLSRFIKRIAPNSGSRSSRDERSLVGKSAAGARLEKHRPASAVKGGGDSFPSHRRRYRLNAPWRRRCATKGAPAATIAAHLSQAKALCCERQHTIAARRWRRPGAGFGQRDIHQARVEGGCQSAARKALGPDARTSIGGPAWPANGAILFEAISTRAHDLPHAQSRLHRPYIGVAGDVVLTSVGAYQLEGLGVHLFDRIEGESGRRSLACHCYPLLAFLRQEGSLAA